MLLKHKRYLDDIINISHNTIRDGIEDIIKNGQKICPEKIVEIFLSEYINTEKKQIYDGFWMFSENYIMEAKIFNTRYDIDIMKYTNSIKYFQFIVKEYDFKKAQSNSSITLKFMTKNTNMTGIIRASGANCDVLNMIYGKYFKNNLI